MACFDKNSFSFSPVKTVKIIRTELNGDHTDYVIQVTIGLYEWIVRRRYSEFLKLNDALPTELKDVAKQLLPRKHFFRNNSESVVKDRQKKLEIYLQCLFRSLPKIIYSLLDFLKFNVYEIHGITELLAEELYNEGEDILSNKKAFSLSTIQLHAICRRMELPEPTSAGDPKRDMGHLLDFINRLKTLKVIGNWEMFGMSNILPNDLPVHFQHFKSLRSMQFENCNFQQLLIDAHLRRNLKKIHVFRSLACISEILLAGIQWDDPSSFPPNIIQDYSWLSLEKVILSCNKIHSINASLKLMPNLKSLDLSHNCLEKMELLEGLQNLQHLNVSYNKLESMSLAVVQLASLTELNISHNKLKSLSALVGLKALLRLNALYNEIELIEELSCLGKLQSLMEVELFGNPISQKPDYRLIVLQMFGDRFHKIILDEEKVSEKEKDAILVRQAIQVATEDSGSPNSRKNVFCNKNFSRKPSSILQHSYESGAANPPGTFSSCLSVSSPNLRSADANALSESVPNEEALVNSPCQEKELPRVLDEVAVNCTSSHNNILTSCVTSSQADRKSSSGPLDGILVPVECRDEGEVERLKVLQQDSSKAEECEKQESSHNSPTVKCSNLINPPFLLGLQKIEGSARSASLKHLRRRKYFLLPETLPNHNNRCLMSLLEDVMDPPDSFGLPEVEYRHNNVGHVMWCSALTNLRKSSHTQERPVCVCVTPFKIHIFKVDQLRGDAGIPKLRYFSFVLISDIHCFMIGSRHLYLRIIDRFHPMHVIVLLTFNRIKTESFLEHVKKASRRNIPFLDDYEDPVVINCSLQCELQISEFLKNFEGSLEMGIHESPSNSLEIQFYQLAQFISEAESSYHFRTSAVVFSNNFFYVLFQDFSNFPKSSNNILEFVPSQSSQHHVAAVFPLSCCLQRIRQYDGETIDKLEWTSDVPEFIGYGLELHFCIQQQFQVVNLRWPTSCLRQEFVTHLHQAFASKTLTNNKLENFPAGEDKNSGMKCMDAEKHLFRRTFILDDKIFRSNVSC